MGSASPTSPPWIGWVSPDFHGRSLSPAAPHHQSGPSLRDSGTATARPSAGVPWSPFPTGGPPGPEKPSQGDADHPECCGLLPIHAARITFDAPAAIPADDPVWPGVDPAAGPASLGSMPTRPSGPTNPIRCIPLGLALGLLLSSLGSCGCSRAQAPRLLTPAPVFPEVIRPLDGSVGTVIRVHERLRFVILDYSLSALPPSGSTLAVYRGSERVGRLRLSRWTSPATAAADFVEGVPRIGDIARPE